MKFTVSNKKTNVQFQDLKPGQLFHYNGALFLKISVIDAMVVVEKSVEPTMIGVGFRGAPAGAPTNFGRDITIDPVLSLSVEI